jgi:O-antigen ligase
VLTLRRGADRSGLKLMTASISALTCGVAVGVRPTTVLLASVAGVGVVGCILMPMRHLPSLLLAATIVIPTLILEGVGGSGQARAVVLIMVFALGRVLMARSRLAVPAILPLSIGAALAATIVTALVATSRPAREIGATSDLVRDLSYPAAAVIGFVGGSYARSQRRPLAIPCAFGWLAIIAAFASVWYWAWRTSGVSPPASGVFNQVAATSGFGTRSVFPFVEDSPNLAAVLFVLMCAFAAPPLLLGSAGHTKLLGVLVLLAGLAGVLTTQSRTGLFAAAAVALAYLLLVKRSGGRQSTAVAGLVILCSVVVYVFGTFPAERTGDDTLVARVHIWSQAWSAFLQDPIIGHGYEYSISGNFIEAGHGGAVSQYQSTHSDILSHLVDGGVVGTTIFVALLGLMLVVARRSLAAPETRTLGVGYSCTLAGVVVAGFDNTLSQCAAAVTFEWLLFGVMVGICPPALLSLCRGQDPRRPAVGELRPSGIGRGLPSTFSSDGAIACAE